MGRVSQFVDFINRKKMPTKDEQDLYYTHISLDEDKKSARSKYKALRRKQKKAP